MHSKQMQIGNVKAVAVLRDSVMVKGGYEVVVTAHNTTLRPLGTKQQALADDMKLQVGGMLAAELEAQGWYTERRLILGRTPAFWFAPEVNR